MHTYQLFNFHIHTPFECPELLEPDSCSQYFPSVYVSYGNVLKNLDSPLNMGPVYEATNELFLLKVGVGQYLIRNGSEIIIQPAHNATEKQLRLLLFGSAMGALLNQRGYFVLHASAIATNKGAVIVMGISGAGKSTTIQSFVDKGYKQLADETVALYYDKKSQQVMALPSFPSTKLWKNSVEKLDKDMKNLTRVSDNFEKFHLYNKTNFVNKAIPLFAVYHLVSTRESDELLMEELNASEKLKTLFDNTYRRKYSDKLRCKENHFTIATRAVNQAHIKLLKRPDLKDTFKELIQFIEKDLDL